MKRENIMKRMIVCMFAAAAMCLSASAISNDEISSGYDVSYYHRRTSIVEINFDNSALYETYDYVFERAKKPCEFVHNSGKTITIYFTIATKYRPRSLSERKQLNTRCELGMYGEFTVLQNKVNKQQLTYDEMANYIATVINTQCIRLYEHGEITYRNLENTCHLNTNCIVERVVISDTAR